MQLDREGAGGPRGQGQRGGNEHMDLRGCRAKLRGCSGDGPRRALGRCGQRPATPVPQEARPPGDSAGSQVQRLPVPPRNLILTQLTRVGFFPGEGGTLGCVQE